MSRIGVPDGRLEQDMSLEDYINFHRRLPVFLLLLIPLHISAWVTLV